MFLYAVRTAGHCGLPEKDLLPTEFSDTAARTVERKRFNILTGTLLDNHKISISEWIEFCLNLFRHDSFSSTSANNKNSTTTTAYWTKKLFLLFEDYTEGIVLTGNVYIDETYYNEKASNRTLRNGKELRGISKNKYCIAMGFGREKV